MDRRERLNDLYEGIVTAITGHQATTWTAIPAVISSFNASRMTVEAKPAVPGRIRLPSGEFIWRALPLLVDCPVVFPGGGGFTLTFPIAKNDECLIILASRCIDAWWDQGFVLGGGGDEYPPPFADMRMHDLSDGFALVGPRSRPRALSSVSTTAVELRNDAGSSYVQIAASGNVTVEAAGDVTVTASGNVAVDAAGNVTVTAPNIALIGSVTVTGNLTVTGTSINNGKNVGDTHTHSGVDPGGGTSGPPT